MYNFTDAKKIFPAECNFYAKEITEGSDNDADFPPLRNNISWPLNFLLLTSICY